MLRIVHLVGQAYRGRYDRVDASMDESRNDGVITASYVSDSIDLLGKG